MYFITLPQNVLCEYETSDSISFSAIFKLRFASNFMSPYTFFFFFYHLKGS